MCSAHSCLTIVTGNYKEVLLVPHQNSSKHEFSSLSQYLSSNLQVSTSSGVNQCRCRPVQASAIVTNYTYTQHA